MGLNIRTGEPVFKTNENKSYYSLEDVFFQSSTIKNGCRTQKTSFEDGLYFIVR